MAKTETITVRVDEDLKRRYADAAAEAADARGLDAGQFLAEVLKTYQADSFRKTAPAWAGMSEAVQSHALAISDAFRQLAADGAEIQRRARQDWQDIVTAAKARAQLAEDEAAELRDQCERQAEELAELRDQLEAARAQLAEREDVAEQLAAILAAVKAEQ